MRRFLWALALLGAVAAGCGGGGGDDSPPPTAGPSRPYQMGFSSLPRELSADAYAESFDFAGDHGDIVLIQRTLPWSDFLPGSDISDDTAETTASERSALDDSDLSLFFAIDVTDGATGRDRIAGLPVERSGQGFEDPDIRAAFIAYAEYVALNYEPEYIALGVEMNLYYEKNKERFADFISLYREAYDAVKKHSPDTQVTVTLQYEDLQGLLPREDPHFPSWQLVREFEPNLDFVAISTYPSFAFARADAMPDSYYSQLRAFTDRPIAIAEMGYSSADGVEGMNSGTEEEQARFLRRALGEAETLPLSFVIWFAIWDPAYARDTAFAAFQSIGLLGQDEEPKPAWQHWEDAERRPYRPVADEAAR